MNNLIVSQRQRRFGVGRNEMSSPAAGMTLIELMIAMTVLAIGLPACMMMILVGMQTNSRNKTDTTATILDQEIVEKFATLKQYPKPTFVAIYDCALSGGSANVHNASLGAGVAPAGSGAALYTGASASEVGNIDWTQAVPALATSAAQGYAMESQTCSGDIYEVRWNVMEISPNPNSRISQLTVSARETAAAGSKLGMLFAPPTTLST